MNAFRVIVGVFLVIVVSQTILPTEAFGGGKKEGDQKDDSISIEELNRKPDNKSTIKWLQDNPKAVKTVCASKEWLEAHPKVVGTFLKNSTWLQNHPNVAKELYANRAYLNANPQVALKLYSRKKWLTAHPEVAIEVYRNSEFINSHPGLATQLYSDVDSLKAHPEVAKEACKNTEFLDKHPQIRQELCEDTRSAEVERTAGSYVASSEKSGLVTSDFFGVQAIGHGAQAVKLMEMSFEAMKDMGVGYVVIDPSVWTEMEPNPPSGGVHSYRWDQEDIKYKVAKKYGLKVQAMLQARSNWATTRKEKDSDEKCCDMFPLKPGYEKDWKAFVKAYVERYYDYGLREITIGNEINVRGHFGVYGGNAENYTVILSNAYRGAKEANPNMKVAMGFASFGSRFDDRRSVEALERKRDTPHRETFFEYLLKHAKDSFDVFTAQCNDSYTGIAPLYSFVRKEMLRNGYEKPIAGEHAISTQLIRADSKLPSYYADVNPKDGKEDIYQVLENPRHLNYENVKKIFFADQAKQTFKKLVTALAAGMEKIFIAVSADPYSCERNTYTWGHHTWKFSGLIETRYYCISGDISGARKPAYYSYKMLADAVIGASRTIETLNLGNDVFGFKFVKDNKPLYILWHESFAPDRTTGLVKRNQQTKVDLSTYVRTQNVRVRGIVTELDDRRRPLYPSDRVVAAASVQIDEIPVFVEETP